MSGFVSRESANPAFIFRRKPNFGDLDRPSPELAFHSLRPFDVRSLLKTGILSRFLKSPAKRNDVQGRNVVAFLNDLVAVAPPAGGGHYGFKNQDGRTQGFVQLISTERLIQIHRIWATEPGKGGGSIMMRTLCELADRHGVEMKLKVIPIGRKPFPMSREQLKAWYQRFNFAGSGWTLIRKPVSREFAAATPAAQSAL